MNKKPGTPSFLVVIFLVVIVAAIGWVSERDYKHQREIADLRLQLEEAEQNCPPPIELSMPFEIGNTKL